MLELLTIPQKGGFPNPLPFQYRVILYANTKKPKSFLYTLSYFEVLSFHGKNHRPRKFKMNETNKFFVLSQFNDDWKLCSDGLR